MKTLKQLTALIDAELVASEPDNTGWYTVDEFKAEWNISETQTRRRVKHAMDAGILECAKRPRKRRDGAIQAYTMYRYADPQ